MVFIIKLGEAIHTRAARQPAAPASAEALGLRKQLQDLQEELRELRDTATQHAMSLDRNVELLTERLNQIESARGEQVQRRLGGQG